MRSTSPSDTVEHKTPPQHSPEGTPPPAADHAEQPLVEDPAEQPLVVEDPPREEHRHGDRLEPEARRGRNGLTANAYASPTPIRLEVVPSCRLFYAPITDDVKVNISVFLTAVDNDVVHKKIDYVWSRASLVAKGHLISLPVEKMDHLIHFHNHPTIHGKFILVSWIGRNIQETHDSEGITRLLTPLIITPLPSDMTPVQAANLVNTVGDNPIWGPTTNSKKLAPPKAFQVMVWNISRRNQILRNGFLQKPPARIVPVIPTDFQDDTAVIVHNKTNWCIDTNLLNGLIGAYATALPVPQVVSQIFDYVSKVEEQKWLVAFRYCQEAAVWINNKDWLQVVDAEKGIKLAVGKCGGTSHNQPNPNAKKARGSGARGARGGKKKARGGKK